MPFKKKFIFDEDETAVNADVNADDNVDAVEEAEEVIEETPVIPNTAKVLEGKRAMFNAVGEDK